MATAPTQQATDVKFTAMTGTTATVSWVRGNGSFVAVFIRASTSSGEAAPVDLASYSANTAVGSGTQIGSSGWRCIYNGVAATVNITGMSLVAYRAHACEYNGTLGAERYLATANALNPNNGGVCASQGVRHLRGTLRRAS